LGLGGSLRFSWAFGPFTVYGGVYRQGFIVALGFIPGIGALVGVITNKFMYFGALVGVITNKFMYL
jgi:hypothetical protein